MNLFYISKILLSLFSASFQPIGILILIMVFHDMAILGINIQAFALFLNIFFSMLILW